MLFFGRVGVCGSLTVSGDFSSRQPDYTATFRDHIGSVPTSQHGATPVSIPLNLLRPSLCLCVKMRGTTPPTSLPRPFFRSLKVGSSKTLKVDVGDKS